MHGLHHQIRRDELWCLAGGGAPSPSPGQNNIHSWGLRRALGWIRPRRLPRANAARTALT